MVKVVERRGTSGNSRVDSQMVQAGDVGAIYGGTLIEGAANVEQALDMSGLNWDVELRHAKYNGKIVEGRFWTVRTDTDTAIDIVGQRYEVIKNRDAFAFVDEILNGGAGIVGAGSLFGGRRVWINVDLGGFDVVPGDQVRKHLLLINTHDTSAHMIIKNSPGRLRCQNALDYELRQDRHSGLMYIRHTASAKDKLEQAHRVVEQAESDYAVLQKMYGDWARVHVDADEVDRIVRNVLGVSDKDLKAFETGETTRQPHWVNHRLKIRRQIYQGPGADDPNVRGTLWNTFNGINGYYDHIRTVKGEKECPDARLESRLLGSSAEAKRKAFDVCKEFAHSLN